MSTTAGQACPACQLLRDPDAKFCGGCGIPLPRAHSSGRSADGAPLALSDGESTSALGNYRRGFRALLVVWLIAVLVALAWGGTRWWQQQESQLQVIVEQRPGGQVLVVRPRVYREGLRVIFGSRQLPVGVDGAVFPLQRGPLRVGHNLVSLKLVTPDNKLHTVQADVRVPFRVDVDLTPMRDRPMAIDAVVVALPKSRVWLDGVPVKLSKDGIARRRYELRDLPSGQDAVYEHVFRYRITTPSSERFDGARRAVLARTAVKLEGDFENLVTEHDAVEISGATHPDAQLRIAGTPVPVHGGHFAYRCPLPELGAHSLVIDAQAPGHLPTRLVRHVVRTRNVNEQAADFAADPRVSYASIGPDPAKYRGQKIRIVGRVYNVEADTPATVLQVMARECEPGDCPLWVKTVAPTEFAIGDWVEVLGTVSGAQQFKTEDGKVQSVPRVDAEYVLAR